MTLKVIKIDIDDYQPVTLIDEIKLKCSKALGLKEIIVEVIE